MFRTFIALAFGISTAYAESFVHHDKIIHPLVIKRMTAELCDTYPVVRSVDLRAAMQSDEYSVPFQVTNDWAVTHFDHGYFGYVYMGRSSSGTHVVRTYDGGGGSGVFQSILLIKREHRPFISDGKAIAHDCLVLTGRYGLGDRDPAKVIIDGDNLVIRGSNIYSHDVRVPLN